MAVFPQISLVLFIGFGIIFPTAYPFYEGHLLTNEDVDAGKDFSNSVASLYKNNGSCFSQGVVISSSTVLTKISCFGWNDVVGDMGVSLASVTAMTGLSLKPSAREFHSVLSYRRIMDRFVTLKITPEAIPPTSKAVPVPFSTSPNPPPTGQRCIGLGFGGVEAHSYPLNVVEFSVLSLTECQKVLAPIHISLDPRMQFCAWITLDGTSTGISQICGSDAAATIFCESWGGTTTIKKRREEKKWFPKDKEEEEDEEEEAAWVFAGFPSYLLADHCGIVTGKPVVFDYVNRYFLL